MSAAQTDDPVVAAVVAALRGEWCRVSRNGEGWLVDTTPEGRERLHARHLREPFARGSITIRSAGEES